MKHFFSILLISIIIISEGFCQTPPILRATDPDDCNNHFGFAGGDPGSTSGFELTNNTNTVPINSYNDRDINLTCNSLNDVGFWVRWTNPRFNADVCKTVAFAVKLYKVPYSHLNTLPTSGGEFIYDGVCDYYPLGFDLSERTVVFHSGLIYTDEDDSPATHPGYNNTNLEVNIDADHAYFIEVIWKNASCPSGWKTELTQSINFDAGADTELNLVPFNSIGSVSLPSFYGTTEVYEFNLLNDILFDASASNCEDRHLYTVQEFDLATWTGLGTPYNSGWIMSPADEIDLTPHQMYLPGKVYHMSAAVGPVWDSENYFFRVKQATVAANLPASQGYHVVTIPQHGGGTAVYNVQELCNNIVFIYLDGSGSEYESKWRVEVVEMDPTDMTEVGTTAHYPGGSAFEAGEAPSNINVKNIYNGEPGNSMSTSKTYKVTLFVGENVVQKKVYFDFKTCGRPRNATNGSGEMTSVNNDLLDFNVYPNPTSNIFNIEIPVSESDVNIQLYNSAGQLIYSKSATGNVEAINTDQLPNGMYILTLTGSFGTLQKKVSKM